MVRAEVSWLAKRIVNATRGPHCVSARKRSVRVYRFIDEQFCLQTKEIMQNFPRHCVRRDEKIRVCWGPLQTRKDTRRALKLFIIVYQICMAPELET